MILQGQVGEGAPYVFGTSCGARETSESSNNESKLFFSSWIKEKIINFLHKCNCTEIQAFNTFNFVIIFEYMLMNSVHNSHARFI